MFILGRPYIRALYIIAAAHALLQLRELRLVDVPLEVPLHLLQLLLELVELLLLRDLVP